MATPVMTSAARRREPVGVDRPDPEVPERAKRRRFTAQYKLDVLRELDACNEPGQVGAVLRREGLYSSHIVEWRRQRDAGALRELGRKRGRKPAGPLERKVDRLERQNVRLRRRLGQAEKIIEVQGKLSELLGIPFSQTSEDDENGTST